MKQIIRTYNITTVKPYNKQLKSSQANPRNSLIMEKGFLLIEQCTGFNFKDRTKPAFPETVTKLQIQQIRINLIVYKAPVYCSYLVSRTKANEN